MIRDVKQEDFKGILTLIKEFYEEQMKDLGLKLKNEEDIMKDIKSLFDNDNIVTLVAESRGKIVGICSGAIVDPVIFSGKIMQELVWFVNKNSRKEGIGLLKAFEKKCIDLGCNEIAMIAFDKTKASDILNKIGYLKLESTYRKVINKEG